MDGYLLFSHGSLLCGAGEALDVHLDRIRVRIGAPAAIGYLNYSSPTVEDAVDSLVAEGATRIVVMPYFLVPGYFVSHSLPERLASVRSAHPEITFTVAPALGTDSRLGEALVAAAEQALSSGDRWVSEAVMPVDLCRARPDCPLYGTARCPAPLADPPIEA
jgi:sirohydrochlorin ferrochelatase